MVIIIILLGTLAGCNKRLGILAVSTVVMTKGCTAMVPAARDALLKDIPNIVTGKTTAQKVVENCLALMRE